MLWAIYTSCRRETRTLYFTGMTLIWDAPRHSFPVTYCTKRVYIIKTRQLRSLDKWSLFTLNKTRNPCRVACRICRILIVNQVTQRNNHSWIKKDQLDVTCFIISLFTAQQVSNVSTSIFRSLPLTCGFISWVVLLWFIVCWCYGVVRLGWCGIQHVSNVSTSIFRSLPLICGFISWVVLLWFDVCWCYGVVRLGWCGILMQAEACTAIAGLNAHRQPVSTEHRKTHTQHTTRCHSTKLI